MSNTRYRRGKLYAADMAVYSRQMSADNSREISRLRHNLIRALREDVTEKQRTALLLYYAEGYNMREIGEQMGVDKSTVSRTIKRGGAASPAVPALWRSPSAGRTPGGALMESLFTAHAEAGRAPPAGFGKFSFRVGARPVGWSPLPWDGGGS